MEQPTKLTVREIGDEAFRFFNLEKGLLFTLIALLKKPLETIKVYLYSDRRKFSNPLQFILIGVGLYTLIISYNAGFQEFISFSEAQNKNNFAVIEKQFNIVIAEPIALSQDLLFSYQNVFYLLILPVISLITYWLFSDKYNFAENLAINAYVFGTSTWVAIILTILTTYTPWPILVFTALMVISFIVITYLYKKIYQTSWLMGLATMMLVYMLIMIITLIVQTGFVVFYNL